MKVTAPPPHNETICAIATPPGVGGVGIVRISGPGAVEIARSVGGKVPAPRTAVFTRFRDVDGSLIDSGLMLFFPGPHSFTGEDVVEMQGHGGPVVLQMLLNRVRDLGARSARPGEFSERAFLNDKLDLAQAEAIADLVTSATDTAARAAQQSLSGVFSRRVAELQEAMTRMRVFVEAAIDFPDEEIDFLAESDILQQVQQTRETLALLLAEARQGRLLHDGLVLAIVGRPNAGKSSLLNALSGQDSAIVTETPGTTRDVLRERIDLDGVPAFIADTAGLRDTDDQIEAEGVRRARRALQTADLALLVVDTSAELRAQLALRSEMPDPGRTLVVCNKCDLLEKDSAGQPASLDTLEEHLAGIPHVYISASTGSGLVDLKARILQFVGTTEQSEGGFTARQRHVDALKRAAAHLQEGERQLSEYRAGELLAEELRLAQQDLGEITGETVADDLLGEIFSSFCIGK